MFGLFRKTNRCLDKKDKKFDLWKGYAIVTEAIQPNCRGCVQFRGSWWFARSLTEITVSPGVWVNVIGRDELTLLVELPKAIDFQQN